ncbi:spider silk-constituting element SpiCE-NMa1 [Trichonephila clavipes]|uniref:Spider silk-constituting element SpiCE-NMa1 n=1 Tax=Trichonephila clavipes TaxID=2585209 RepID=A0A8X6WFD3_TRICX|nr:spider silk-constituting element SpiCE-NMa1 [Trichonephila clavipes]
MSKILSILVVFTTLSYTSANHIKKIEKLLSKVDKEGMQCDDVRNVIRSYSNLLATVMDAGSVLKGAFGDFRDNIIEGISNPEMQKKLKSVKHGLASTIKRFMNFESSSQVLQNVLNGLGGSMQGFMGDMTSLGGQMEDLKGSMKDAFAPPLMNMVGTGYSMLDNMASGGLMNNVQDFGKNAMSLGKKMMFTIGTAENHDTAAHIMTDPPSCLTVGKIQSGSNACKGVLQTSTHPIVGESVMKKKGTTLQTILLSSTYQPTWFCAGDLASEIMNDLGGVMGPLMSGMDGLTGKVGGLSGGLDGTGGGLSGGLGGGL